MKKAIIVHCWDGYPEYCWYPDVKKELEKKGFEVLVPAMPDTNVPNLSKWLPKLKEIAGTPDEDTYLIGHSIGCITIMRYLESLSEKQKIGGAIFVAGFTDDLGFKELKNFFETPINFKKIKLNSKQFVDIISDNDPYVPLDRGDIIKEKLGAEVIVKHNAKHFSGPVDNESSCTKLPDVVDAIMKFSN